MFTLFFLCSLAENNLPMCLLCCSKETPFCGMTKMSHVRMDSPSHLPFRSPARFYWSGIDLTENPLTFCWRKWELMVTLGETETSRSSWPRLRPVSCLCSTHGLSMLEGELQSKLQSTAWRAALCLDADTLRKPYPAHHPTLYQHKVCINIKDCNSSKFPTTQLWQQAYGFQCPPIFSLHDCHNCQQHVDNLSLTTIRSFNEITKT